MHINKFKADILTKLMKGKEVVVDCDYYRMHLSVRKVQTSDYHSIYAQYHTDVQVNEVYHRRAVRIPGRDYVRDEHGNLTYEFSPISKPPRHMINQLNKYIRYSVRHEFSPYLGFVSLQHWHLDGGKVYWPK